jgi:hypothetical protein
VENVFGVIYRQIKANATAKAVNAAKQRTAKLYLAIEVMREFDIKVVQSFEELQALKKTLDDKRRGCCIFTTKDGLCGLVDEDGELIATALRDVDGVL